MSRSAIGAAVVVVLVGTMLASPATARKIAPGDPDPSFNGTGVRLYQPRGLSASVQDIVVQRDGKILLAGYTGDYYTRDRDAVVLRVNPDGSPDQSFGLGGVVSLDFDVVPGLISTDYAHALALDSSGRIVVAGMSSPDNGGAADGRATIARLRPNGTLDSTFSGDGKLVESFGYACGGSGAEASSGDGLTDVVVLPDGRLRLAGYTGEGSGSGNIVVLGLNADGSRDCGFGSGGRVFLDFGGEDSANAIALAPGGDLVVAGSSDNEYRMATAMARLTTAGALVGGFGDGGRWVAPSDVALGSIEDVLVQPDGRIVLAVSHASDTGLQRAGLIRVNQDGSVDPLGGKSMWMPAIAGNDDNPDYAGAVVRDGQGRLLLSALGVDAAHHHSFRLARFTPGGRLDTTFGHGGLIQITQGVSITGRGYWPAPVLATQSDARIVMAGTAGYRFDVRRFLSDAPSGRAAVSFPRTKVGVKAKQGTWLVACRNVAGDECRITLTLKAKKKPKAKVGVATGTIAGGRSGVLTVRLNKTGKRLLGKGKLKAKAVGTSRNSAGAMVTIKQPLTLKAKKAKKHG